MKELLRAHPGRFFVLTVFIFVAAKVAPLRTSSLAIMTEGGIKRKHIPISVY